MPSIGPFGKNRKAGGAASGSAAVPHIILAGSGVHDRLELTVETQRVIARYGKVFAIGMAAAPRALLKSMRVKVVDLDASFTAERPFEDIYSEVVAQLIEHTAVERPVVLLCPGNHLFLNSGRSGPGDRGQATRVDSANTARRLRDRRSDKRHWRRRWPIWSPGSGS